MAWPLPGALSRTSHSSTNRVERWARTHLQQLQRTNPIGFDMSRMDEAKNKIEGMTKIRLSIRAPKTALRTKSLMWFVLLPTQCPTTVSVPAYLDESDKGSHAGSTGDQDNARCSVFHHGLQGVHMAIKAIDIDQQGVRGRHGRGTSSDKPESMCPGA